MGDDEVGREQTPRASPVLTRRRIVLTALGFGIALGLMALVVVRDRGKESRFLECLAQTGTPSPSCDEFFDAQPNDAATSHQVARQIQERLQQQIEAATFISRYGRERLRRGGPFARLIIPKLGVDLIVVEGTTGDALKAGAGHYEATPLPGRPGNLAIAAHRTEFGQPFRHLDKLAEGDLAILEAPSGWFTYRVVGAFDGHPNPWATEPIDFTVLAPTEEPSMTLTTSDPPEGKKARLIARLVLVRSESK